MQEEAEEDDGLSLGDTEPGWFVLPRHARRVLQLHPAQYREAFLSILRGGDAIAATAAVRVLLALLLCRCVDNALLDAAGALCRCRFHRTPGRPLHLLAAAACVAFNLQICRQRCRIWPPTDFAARCQSCTALRSSSTGRHTDRVWTLQVSCRPNGGSSGSCWMR